MKPLKNTFYVFSPFLTIPKEKKAKAIQDAGNTPTKQDLRLSIPELILSSACSKIIASSAAYPHEVLRARFHHQSDADPHSYKVKQHLIDVLISCSH